MNGTAPTEPRDYLPGGQGHGHVGVGGQSGSQHCVPAAELTAWLTANAPSKPLMSRSFFICFHLRCLNCLVARNREYSTRFHAVQTVVGAGRYLA